MLYVSPALLFCACLHMCRHLSFRLFLLFLKVSPLKGNAYCWSLWRQILDKSRSLFTSAFDGGCNHGQLWRQVESALVQCTRWAALPVLASQCVNTDYWIWCRMHKGHAGLRYCRFRFAGLKHMKSQKHETLYALKVSSAPDVFFQFYWALSA